MNVRNTLYSILLLVLCLGACQKSQLNDLDQEYLRLFEAATKEYKYGNLDESHSKFLEILYNTDKVSSNKDNQRIHLISLNYLGEISLKAGVKELANEEFEKALAFAEAYDNEAYQILSTLNIVNLEDDIEKLKLRIKEANNKFCCKGENKYSLGLMQFALGFLYAENNQPTKALEIFYELLHSETYNDYDKVEIYKGIGIAYRNKNTFKLAIEYFDSAMLMVEDKTIMKLEILVEKAQTFSLNKEYDNFKSLTNSIKPTLDTLKDLTIKKRINELQIGICDQTKDIHGKAQKLTELQAIDKKIDEDSKALLVSIVTNQKNLELKRESDIQTTMRQYLILLLFLSLLLFISIITSLFLFYKHIRSALISFNRYIDGQGAERERLARELHDILAANLAATRLQFILLKEYLPEEENEKVLKMLTDNIKETRRIAYNIMPPVLVNIGLITAIKTKVEFWNNESLQYQFISSVEEVAMYDELKFDLYRCVLECINNIIKYANATEVVIEFTLQEKEILHITIKDNGVGFDVTNLDREEGGLGIWGMKSRIEYFEGNFQIQSKPNQGTIVNISVPIKRSLKKENIIKRLPKILESLYDGIFKKDNIQGIEKY